MFLRLFLLFTFALLSPLAVTTQTVQPTLRTYKNSDAYDVYNEIISRLPSNRLFAAKQLVFSAETLPQEMCLVPEGHSKAVMADAVADYRTRNQVKWLLEPRFRVEKQYELLTPQEIQEGQLWIKLSAVGFNSNRTIAVVAATLQCPGVCANGKFYVFRKKGGRWQPLDWQGSACEWAS